MSSTDREAQVVAMLDELDRLDATTNPKEHPMTSPKPLQVEHQILECPACHQPIVARVEVTPSLSQPELGDGFDVLVKVDAQLTRFNVSHICQGPVLAADPAGVSR